MDDTTILEFSGRDAVTDPLTDRLCKGARELLQAAIEAERDAFLAQFANQRTSDGHSAVVRDGYHPERAVQTGIGPVTVKVPKVRAKDGKPVTFRSALAPPYVRKANLSRDEWVYIWAGGIYIGMRGTDERLCVLVVIGVNARGEKHVLAIEDGVRERTQSWREVLLSLKARGFAAPKLATGGGAVGFWAALEEMFPATRQKRCWVHKTGNVLNYLPKRTQPKAKKDAA